MYLYALNVLRRFHNIVEGFHLKMTVNKLTSFSNHRQSNVTGANKENFKKKIVK